MGILAESAQAVMLFLREEGYTEEILSRLGPVEITLERLGEATGLGVGSHRRCPARSVDPALLSWRIDDGEPEREVHSERDSARLVHERALGA